MLKTTQMGRLFYFLKIFLKTLLTNECTKRILQLKESVLFD